MNSSVQNEAAQATFLRYSSRTNWSDGMTIRRDFLTAAVGTLVASAIPGLRQPT